MSQVADNLFNDLLVEMDVVAKRLASMFPRSFGKLYLASLQHGDSQDFAPAVQVSAVAIGTPRFGSPTARRAKAAREISKASQNRSLARQHMQQVANGFNNKIIEVIEAVDEVNRRPADREYRPDSASIIRVANDSLDALNVVEAEIKAAEDSLFAKYELRANILRQNDETTDITSVPTVGLAVVVGPRHYYDRITIYDFGSSVPAHEPLVRMFRAINSVRKDDVLLSGGEKRAFSRRKHRIATQAGLAEAKTFR